MSSISTTTIIMMIVITIVKTKDRFGKRNRKWIVNVSQFCEADERPNILPKIYVLLFCLLIFAQFGQTKKVVWRLCVTIYKRSTVRAYSIMSVLSRDTGLVMPSVYEATWPSAPKLWGFSGTKNKFGGKTLLVYHLLLLLT